MFKDKAELEQYQETLETEIRNLNNLLLDIVSPGFKFFLEQIQKDFNQVNNELDALTNLADAPDKIGMKAVKLITQREMLRSILATESKTKNHRDELVKRLEKTKELNKIK